MKKKLLLCALALVLVFLSGCAGTKHAEEMTLTPIAREEAAQNAGENGVPPVSAEYKVGVPVKSAAGTLHVLRNGEWETSTARSWPPVPRSW